MFTNTVDLYAVICLKKTKQVVSIFYQYTYESKKELQIPLLVLALKNTRVDTIYLTYDLYLLV